MVVRVGVLTVSDRCSRGEAEDKSGPAARQFLEGHLPEAVVVSTACVPDDIAQIQRVLLQWCDDAGLDLVVTTGGTGFGPRDLTPEAVKGILEREAPGLVVAMLVEALKITPFAMLSRPVAGTRRATLLLTLPGSPKAVVENLSPLLPALPHALQLLKDAPHTAGSHPITAKAT